MTAVRGTHLSRAGSIDEIERGKRELVEALPAGGTAVLNADDERVARMADHVPAGVDVADLRLRSNGRRHAPTDVAVARLRRHALRLLHADGDAVDVTMPALGRHSVHNGLAAAAVGLAAGTGPRDDRARPGAAVERAAPHDDHRSRADRGSRRQLQRQPGLDDRCARSAGQPVRAATSRSWARCSSSAKRRAPSTVAWPSTHAQHRGRGASAIGPYPIAEARADPSIDAIAPAAATWSSIKGSRGAAMELLLPALEDQRPRRWPHRSDERRRAARPGASC